jgi:hypothetical protein
MFSRLASRLTTLAAAAALTIAADVPLSWAQTNSKPTPPAQKTPAKPGAQSGPEAAASASGPTMSPPAEKKPAKPGAQSGPKASGPNR